MGSVLKPITAADIGAVVRIMNESSAGHSFQFHLDFMKYLVLSRFWNFSYDFSYLAWADDQPAGVVLSCVDRTEGEAYSFYWGVIPEFRKRRLSMELARTYLAEVKRHGLRRTYADSSADSPLDIYLKLGFEVAHRLVELRTAALPQADIAGIEPLDTATLLAEMPTFPPAPRSWIGRPAFLQSAASFLEFKGIRGSGRLDAYVAISRWAGETTIIALDFREGAEECGYRLISHLRTYPPPYSASHIVSGSRSERLLRDCGFHTGLQWVSIALALDTYLPRR